MRKVLTYALLVAAMLAAVLLPPWLAWKESYRQAFDIQTGLSSSYARDVIHRSDATADQAARRIRELRESGYPPCSAKAQQLMRVIDLETTYIQAIGAVRNGVMVCSSLGKLPIPLGPDPYRTSKGYTIYSEVPLEGDGKRTPLLALERDGFAVLIHRDLPIDATVSEAEVSLGLFHTERKQTIITRGFIDPAWVARLNGQLESTIVDGAYLVTFVRSTQTLVAAIAAVPLTHVDRRAVTIAWRLVPAAALGGAIIAALVFLAWRSQTSIDSALRQALRRHELYLVYQPIVDLASGAVVGVEALLRWRRASGEDVSPELFIPVAERGKLILDLSNCVMQMIARDTAGYLATHPDFHVAINLSASDFQTDAIVGKIEHLIAACGAKPSNFILEITERSFLNLDAARTVLQELRKREIAVAIDDFGTGYSSLSYLESLHVDYLKIDRSFIEAIGTGAPTSQVVGHIIEMARTMHLKMIAEGIESDAQAAFLRERHVQFAQGWSFGKPMPFGDIVRRLREGTIPYAAAQSSAH
jgi:sensor c-di-GMP phosphodiesterase-like protein